MQRGVTISALPPAKNLDWATIDEALKQKGIDDETRQKLKNKEIDPNQRKTYSPDFREAIVYLVKQDNYKQVQIAKALEIPMQTITTWCGRNDSISPAQGFDWQTTLRKEGVSAAKIEKLEKGKIAPAAQQKQYSNAYKEATVYLIRHPKYDYSQTQIAKALEIPIPMVSRWCRDDSISPAQGFDWQTILRQEGVSAAKIEKLEKGTIVPKKKTKHSLAYKEAIVYLVRHAKPKYTQAQIAEALDISETTVSSWCRDKSISPAQEFDWQTILRQGDVSEETIDKIKAGTITPAQQKKYSRAYKEATVYLIRHLKHGYTQAQMAETLDISEKTVSVWCNDKSISPGEEFDWQTILRQGDVSEETIDKIKAGTITPAQQKKYSRAYKEAIVYLIRHPKHDYTQAQMAEALDISGKTVSMWCNDKSISPGEEFDWEPILRKEGVLKEKIQQLEDRALPPAQRKTYSLAVKEAIVSLIRHYHYSQPQIAKALRISKKTVETWSYNKSICPSQLPWQRIEVTLREGGIEQNWIDELSKMKPAHSSRVQSAS